MTATAIRLEEFESPSPAPAGAAVSEMDDELLKSILAELRTRLARPVELRPASGLAAELDVPGFYASAHWEAGRGRVRLPIAGNEPSMPPACREAVETMVGLVAGAVVGVDRDDSAFALTVAVDGGPSAPDVLENLVTAFEALTVAARMGIAEAEALAADETLAGLYLAAVREGESKETVADKPNETN